MAVVNLLSVSIECLLSVLGSVLGFTRIGTVTQILYPFIHWFIFAEAQKDVFKSLMKKKLLIAIIQEIKKRSVWKGQILSKDSLYVFDTTKLWKT